MLQCCHIYISNPRCNIVKIPSVRPLPVASVRVKPIRTTPQPRKNTTIKILLTTHKPPVKNITQITHGALPLPQYPWLRHFTPPQSSRKRTVQTRKCRRSPPLPKATLMYHHHFLTITLPYNLLHLRPLDNHFPIATPL